MLLSIDVVLDMRQHFHNNMSGRSATFKATDDAPPPCRSCLSLPSFVFCCFYFGSGTISTTNFVDRLLGRFSALLRFSFIDGINDHSSSEYLRLSRQALVNSRVSLLAKTRSVVVDAVKKVSD